MTSFESSSKASEKKPGFGRLAAGAHDRDAWATVVARLATRTTAGLVDDPTTIKEEDDPDSKGFSMKNGIRGGLLKYVLTDFRKRIDVAIAWLNEEWYNERIQSANASGPYKVYNEWSLRFLDGLVPYIDNGDRLLIRFMSEVQEVNREMLERIKKLAQDPERVRLAVMVLQYLVMFRVPVREMCLDALEDMYKTNPAAKAHTVKVLQTRRPSAVATQASPTSDFKIEVSAAAAVPDRTAVTVSPT